MLPPVGECPTRHGYSNGKISYQGPGNDPNVINSAVMWHPNNPEHLSNYTYTGYQVQDVNLDGNVVYQGGGSDVNIIFNFKETHPFNTERLNNFIFNEQLPTGSAIISATPTLSALQTIDYKYHIRGGLAGINLNAANQPTPNSQEMDLFSYKLEYESAGQWDGNIGKQTWNNTSNQVRSYTFAYDYAKRLKSGTYSGVGAENYSLTNVNYDKNGNILNLVRNGNLGSSFGVMDNLTYTYTGNKLYKVEDAVSGDYTVDFVNRNAGTNDYDYYSDGSLKKDLNKEITQIDYDPFLKLPKQITLTNNRWIKITYAGDGRVLKRTYSTGEYWEYDGALVHKNGQPYQLATPEGRATYASGVWTYEYFIQDHLGNTRVSFKANGSSPQATDYTNYDPWGIELNGTGLNNPVENRFKYQSKESLSLFSLGGINDFGARYYDKTVGRWWGVDPLSEVARRWTTFAYAFNNPIRFIDPDGMVPGEYYNEQGTKIGDDGKRDNKVFVIKTTQTNMNPNNTPGVSSSNPITKEAASTTENEIRNSNFSGEHMKNLVQIESASNMSKMLDIVSKDDGTGGGKPENNREYGGVVSKGGVVKEAKPGAVSDLSTSSNASITIPSNNDTKSKFHSHPSGVLRTYLPNNRINTRHYEQAPSMTDVNGMSGRKIDYEFGMRANTIFIYNKTGVIATIPFSTFKKP